MRTDMLVIMKIFPDNFIPCNPTFICKTVTHNNGILDDSYANHTIGEQYISR